MGNWPLVGLIALAVPVGILYIVSSHCNPPEDNGVAEEDHDTEFLNDHYTRLAGHPTTLDVIKDRHGTYWDCIIDYEDGTFGLGMGDTPWDAYRDAQDGDPYLGQVTA